MFGLHCKTITNFACAVMSKMSKCLRIFFRLNILLLILIIVAWLSRYIKIDSAYFIYEKVSTKFFKTFNL